MNSTNKERWEVLDMLLQSKNPVCSEDIFKSWKKRGIDLGKDGKYSNILRQDLFRFKQEYRDAGFEGEMLAESERISDDGRKKTFKYAREGFSMMAILNSKYTRSNWAKLERCLADLRSSKSSIPKSLSQKIDFYVCGRLDKLCDKPSRVDWSDKPGKAGTELAPILFDYIRKEKPVCFEFSRIVENSEPMLERLTFHPYLLKVYQGRWYCLGYEQGEQCYRTIALDRITLGTLMEAECKFRPYDVEETGLDLENYYSNIIGVTKDARHNPTQEPYVSDGEAEIVLGIHDSHSWNLFKTNPIHPSAVVIDDFDNEQKYGRFRLILQTNIEFYKSILYLGPAVEVESPESVRKTVADMVSKSYKVYFPDMA